MISPPSVWDSHVLSSRCSPPVAECHKRSLVVVNVQREVQHVCVVVLNLVVQTLIDLAFHAKELQITRTIRCRSHTETAGSGQATSKRTESGGIHTSYPACFGSLPGLCRPGQAILAAACRPRGPLGARSRSRQDTGDAAAAQEEGTAASLPKRTKSGDGPQIDCAADGETADRRGAHPCRPFGQPRPG